MFLIFKSPHLERFYQFCSITGEIYWGENFSSVSVFFACLMLFSDRIQVFEWMKIFSDWTIHLPRIQVIDIAIWRWRRKKSLINISTWYNREDSCNGIALYKQWFFCYDIGVASLLHYYVRIALYGTKYFEVPIWLEWISLKNLPNIIVDRRGCERWCCFL